MSLQELIIRDEHLTGLGVLGMADTPGLSTTEMQRKLEELSRELIIPRMNLALEELVAQQKTVDAALAERPTQQAVNTALAQYPTKQAVDAALAERPTQQAVNAALAERPTQQAMDASISNAVNAAINSGMKSYLDTNLASYMGAGSTAMLNAHPVGSIYMSVYDTSPAWLFGGTWERIQDCFLLAAGNSYYAGTAGGEAYHTLTVEELPPHNHGLGTTESVVERGTSYSRISSTGSAVYDVVGYTGWGWAHNNMPPYLAVYVWKRIA